MYIYIYIESERVVIELYIWEKSVEMMLPSGNSATWKQWPISFDDLPTFGRWLSTANWRIAGGKKKNRTMSEAWLLTTFICGQNHSKIIPATVSLLASLVCSYITIPIFPWVESMNLKKLLWSNRQILHSWCSCNRCNPIPNSTHVPDWVRIPSIDGESHHIPMVSLVDLQHHWTDGETDGFPQQHHHQHVTSCVAIPSPQIWNAP